MCLPHKAAPHGVLVEVLCGLFPFPPIEMVLAQPPARLRRGKRGRVLLHHVPKDGGLRMTYSLWRFPPLTRRTMSRDGGGACPDTLGCPMGGWGRTDTRNLKPRLTQPLPRLLLLLECVPMRRDALDWRHPRRVQVGMIGGLEKDFVTVQLSTGTPSVSYWGALHSTERIPLPKPEGWGLFPSPFTCVSLPNLSFMPARPPGGLITTAHQKSGLHPRARSHYANGRACGNLLASQSNTQASRAIAAL